MTSSQLHSERWTCSWNSLSSGGGTCHILPLEPRCDLSRVSGESEDANVRETIRRRDRANHRPWRSLREKIGAIATEADRQDIKSRLKIAQQTKLAAEVKGLAIQGQWARVEDALQDRQWKAMMWSLPSHVAQFATKAALDVLPTRANLARWHVAADSACSCGAKETLLHALNGCELKLSRFKWRHNSVLGFIVAQLRVQRPDHLIFADLPGQDYRLPFDIEQRYRPDIVLQKGNEITFVELTIPFEDKQPMEERKQSTFLGSSRQQELQDFPHACFAWKLGRGASLLNRGGAFQLSLSSSPTSPKRACRRVFAHRTTSG